MINSKNLEEVVRELNKELNKILRGNSNKCFSPHIVLNPSFNDCGFKKLLKSHLYIYSPDKPGQEEVKEKLKEYSDKNRLKFVVTTLECDGGYECIGDYVDPFTRKANDKHVFRNKFPDDINGAYVHFLTRKNYKLFSKIASNLGK